IYGYSISLPSYYFPAMINALFIGRREKNLEVFETTLRNRGQHLFGEAKGVSWPNDDVDLPSFEPSPVLSHYFDSTIAMLRRLRIEVLHRSIPLNKRTHDETSEDLQESFDRYLAATTAKHPNLRIVVAPTPVFADEYFGDDQHLNARGAQIWSDHIK